MFVTLILLNCNCSLVGLATFAGIEVSNSREIIKISSLFFVAIVANCITSVDVLGLVIFIFINLVRFDFIAIGSLCGISKLLKSAALFVELHLNIINLICRIRSTNLSLPHKILFYFCNLSFLCSH